MNEKHWLYLWIEKLGKGYATVSQNMYKFNLKATHLQM